MRQKLGDGATTCNGLNQYSVMLAYVGKRPSAVVNEKLQLPDAFSFNDQFSKVQRRAVAIKSLSLVLTLNSSDRQGQIFKFVNAFWLVIMLRGDQMFEILGYFYYSVIKL